MAIDRFSTLFLTFALGALATSCTSDNGPAATGGPGGGPIQGGGGGGGAAASTESLEEIDLDSDPDGDRIVDMPTSADAVFTDLFGRYTAVEFPAGRVHMLAQSGVDNAKIVRARAILRQHLTNVPGTTEGADKDDVIASMINRGAAYAIFSDAASLDPNAADVAAFLVAMNGNVAAIPAERIVIEGSPEYIATLPAEDNTFGTTAVLVHRSGLVPARASYAAELTALHQSASAIDTFYAPAGTPDEECVSAFLLLAMDTHAGIWGHDPNGDGSAGSAGFYAYGSREDMGSGDPATLAWIERFFATGHDFEAILPADFTGNFDGLRRSATPYTSRSQHLRNLRLTGANTAELFGAPYSSTLVGNDGNNNLKGRAGDDALFGGAGFDTAVFSGPRANYTVTFDGATVIVEDVFGGHDGIDTVVGCERLQFTDGGENL